MGKQKRLRVKDIIEIEKSAYPEYMQQMDDCTSMADIAEYAEVDLKNLIVLGERGKWYVIIAKHFSSSEVVCVAKVKGAPMIPWVVVLQELRRKSIRRIYGDLRERTSYRVLKRFGSMFGVSIVSDRVYYDDCYHESMHHVVIDI